MSNASLVVILVDGLRARALGAYGNTCYPTPALDGLASQSLLFEHYWANSTELAEVYDSVVSGSPVFGQDCRTAQANLISQLSSAGYFTHLVTDEPQVMAHPLAKACDELSQVNVQPYEPAETPIDTAMGQVLQAAAEVLGQWNVEAERPRCLWVHLRGFLAAWDAPPELAASLRTEEDLELPASIAVPDQTLGSESEEELWQLACRYAAQVMALDACWEAFDHLLTELWRGAAPVVVWGGTRGFALGEHQRVGQRGPYGERFHVPLLLRLPEGQRSLQRQAGFFQPADLGDLLTAAAAPTPLPSPAHQLAYATTAEGGWRLQTPEWSWVGHSMAEPDQPLHGELYVQPDDRWEANNVASRCPEVVEKFARLTAEVQRCVAADKDFRQLTLD